MTVFDRRSKKIQRDYAAKLPNSKNYDYLRDEIAKRVGERLDVSIWRSKSTSQKEEEEKKK